MSAHNHVYDATFYDWVEQTAKQSARGVLPRVLACASMASVCDVGCGQGVWLSIYEALGVADYLGLDGSYVDLARLEIPPDRFLATDLREPFDLGRRFDLVQSMEVAEHLPESSADGFVDSLCHLADIVVFSAAIPGQGGEHHVNEQPLEYWRDKFAARGYALFDWVRAGVAADESISSWYRFNVLLFANAAGRMRFAPGVARTEIAPDAPIPSLRPLGNRVRNAVLARLPEPVVTRLSRFHYQWMTRKISAHTSRGP